MCPESVCPPVQLFVRFASYIKCADFATITFSYDGAAIPDLIIQAEFLLHVGLSEAQTSRELELVGNAAATLLPGFLTLAPSAVYCL